MTDFERRMRARRLCRRLSDDVREVAPAGLGRWEPAWEIVAEASRRFLTALERWERIGASADVDAVRAAYDTVVDAWREAAARWEAQSAPSTETIR